MTQIILVVRAMYGDLVAKTGKMAIRLALCLALALLAARCSHAGPFDQDPRDFAFTFAVTGYEQESWFGEPAALALNQGSGLVYVADMKAGTVDVFTLQGVPKLQRGSGCGLKAPVGVAVDKDGNLYVSEDEAGPIKIVDSEGAASTLELPPDENGKAPKPGRMTFDRDCNLYVVDRANGRICVFDRDKKLKLKFGKAGDKRGEFRELQDVAVDRQGRIYALDAAGVPVHVFDKKGKYLYRFGFRGDGLEDVAVPSGLFIDRNGQVWIVDRGQHCLKVFDRSGSFLRSFGVYGLAEGALSQPVDAEMDNFGRVYVLEAGARRLQVFSLRRPFEPFNPPSL